VENTQAGIGSVTTDGIITYIVPNGFRLTSGIRCEIDGNVVDNVDNDVLIQNNANGTTRITLRGVNLSDHVSKVEYFFTLEYIGDGYGVVYPSVIADYKYIYEDEENAEPLMLQLLFPQNVVGVSVTTNDSHFAVEGMGSTVLEILANDNFIDGTENDMYRMADGDFDFELAVVFTDAVGNPLTVADPRISMVDGNMRFETNDFIATMVRGTWGVVFEPKSGASGSVMLYYRVMLIARQGAYVFDLNSQVTAIKVCLIPTGGSCSCADCTGIAGTSGGINGSYAFGIIPVVGGLTYFFVGSKRARMRRKLKNRRGWLSK
jgi:hypothetical protein